MYENEDYLVYLDYLVVECKKYTRSYDKLRAKLNL